MSHKDLAKEDIIAWLKANPQFFLTHPELVPQLELPSEEASSSGPTSLAQFQARRTQSELLKLQDQLKTLVAVASENERLMHRLHAMTLSLMAIEPLNEFFQALFEQLNEEFGALAIALHLHSIPEALEGVSSIQTYDPKCFSWIDQNSAGLAAQCGRFTKDKLNALFGDEAKVIRSAAVVPMNEFGLLAIGSEDQTKYQPQMGTLFLELLASTLQHRLAGAMPEQNTGP